MRGFGHQTNRAYRRLSEKRILLDNNNQFLQTQQLRKNGTVRWVASLNLQPARSCNTPSIQRHYLR